METLRVSTEEQDGRILIKVAGELDLASAPRIEEALRAAEEKGPALLVLDLRELDFMDSTGLRAILAADARAREADRRVAVVQGNENIRRVFEVTRLYDRVEIVDDPDEVSGA
jgi:anti-sigma B factor antagonist